MSGTDLAHGKWNRWQAWRRAAFISGSVVFLILHAINWLRFPHPLEQVGVGSRCWPSCSPHVIRRTDSMAIRADALHHATDLLPNLSIILPLLL